MSYHYLRKNRSLGARLRCETQHQCKEILNLLPPEFDGWRSGPGVLRLE
jgi:hypothetical protein